MKTTLILTGKTTDKHIDACVDDYLSRIKHYMPLEVQVIPELKNTKNLTEEQVTRLTGGLFDKLPSGLKPHTLTEGENGKARVYLSWYPSGEMERAVIDLGDNSGAMLEDTNEVNKRLSSMFETSKVTNSSYGYRTYYDNGGAAVYYSGYYCFTIGKAEALLGGL